MGNRGKLSVVTLAIIIVASCNLYRKSEIFQKAKYIHEIITKGNTLNHIQDNVNDDQENITKSKYAHMSALDIITSRTNTTKVILYWTPRLGQADWVNNRGKRPFRGCKYNNCRYTSDKTEVHEADILMFYCQELPHFPDVRYPHQLYVHMTREAPVNVKIHGYGMYGKDINVTMSYRKVGPIRAPYFIMVPKETPEAPYVPRIPFQQKTRSAVWMVSNCNPDSKRDLYVRELRKYIDIDIYGKCGNSSCDDSETTTRFKSCFGKFENTYKFYLSFENNICDDYYTEKLLNPLDTK